MQKPEYLNRLIGLLIECIIGVFSLLFIVQCQNPEKSEIPVYSSGPNNFNYDWEFVKDMDTSITRALFNRKIIPEISWKIVDLPHTANIEPLNMDRKQSQGYCFYHKFFMLPSSEAGKHVAVQFECMEFNMVHDLYGSHVSFWGTLGTQQLLPYGTSEEVKKVALDRLSTCGLKGGIVIGPTHIVEPEVPWENIMAILEAANEFQKPGV